MMQLSAPRLVGLWARDETLQVDELLLAVRLGFGHEPELGASLNNLHRWPASAAMLQGRTGNGRPAASKAGGHVAWAAPRPAAVRDDGLGAATLEQTAHGGA
jgi:hypothetical protein